MDASVPKGRFSAECVQTVHADRIKFHGGERSIAMFKEIAENAVTKAKEDISVPQGIIVLIAVASFVTGLVIGIICTSGARSAKSSKIKKSSFRAEDYANELNFDDDDDDGYEYSF